jgi:seryl-tRNA synthetase
MGQVRTAVALLLMVCVGLGLLAYWQATALREQRQQVQQLNAKLESVSKTATLDLQEKCAKQAREEFHSLGWDKHELADVSNHYNAKLNKCFMQIQDTDAKSVRGTIVTSTTVADAFEGKVYATYIWSTQKNKKYWEVPPLECKVTLLSGEEKICHSSDEFDELVKQYME